MASSCNTVPSLGSVAGVCVAGGCGGGECMYVSMCMYVYVSVCACVHMCVCMCVKTASARRNDLVAGRPSI